MATFVYVGNLGSETTESMVQQAFSAAGRPVKKVVILRNPQNDRSRGFGFAEVESEEEVAPVIQTMNGVEIEGRPIKVAISRERPPARTGDGRFQSYSGLGGRLPRGPRTGGGAKRKRRT